MIRKLVVEKLHDCISCDFTFNDDINILTGKNGSGKTSILKLLWYLISGNIERIFPEMKFKNVILETDKYVISISDEDKEGKIFAVSFKRLETGQFLFQRKIAKNTLYRSNYINDLNALVIDEIKESIFFPTFRRIEGGFSTTSLAQDRRYRSPDIDEAELVQNTMSRISEKLTVSGHKFVCSISTEDIIELITKKYASASETINMSFSTFTDDIIRLIDKSDKQEGSLEQANDVLNTIRGKTREVSQKRIDRLKPFIVLSRISNDIYQQKGIIVSENFVFGNPRSAIESYKLSAGEKHMLSFLCYNAFIQNSPIFIDEPELSLHVDWQRILFPTLLRQNTNNQFIIATHSPFIYSKYSDKELVLNEDRGE